MRFLKDSSIMSSAERQTLGKQQIPDIRGIGGVALPQTLLKGRRDETNTAKSVLNPNGLRRPTRPP